MVIFGLRRDKTFKRVSVNESVQIQLEPFSTYFSPARFKASDLCDNCNTVSVSCHWLCADNVVCCELMMYILYLALVEWLYKKPLTVCARVSEPACFGVALALGIFYLEPAPAPAPGKREHNFGIFQN